MAEKDPRKPLYTKLRHSRLEKLDATAKRLEMSRAAVLEVLIWKCADHVQAATIDAAALPPNHRGKRGEGRRKKP
jgi:hypothetical protein